VEILSHQLHKEFQHNLPAFEKSSLLHNHPHVANDLLHIFQSHQIGHFTSIQDIVDIFQEGLFHNLSVREKEQSRGVFGSCLFQQFSEVVLPGSFFIGLGDLDGETGLTSDMSGQSG